MIPSQSNYSRWNRIWKPDLHPKWRILPSPLKDEEYFPLQLHKRQWIGNTTLPAKQHWAK